MFSTVLRLCTLPVLFFGLVAQADVVQTRVFRVEAPTSSDTLYQVLATADGRVYFVAPTERQLAQKLEGFAAAATPISLILDEDMVIDAQPLSEREAAVYSDSFDNPAVVAEATEALDEIGVRHSSENVVVSDTDTDTDTDAPLSLRNARALGYEPTILSSMNQAVAMFAKINPLRHKSQCYERAHVWSHQLEKWDGLRSMKVFLFFTNTFRNRYYTKFLFVRKAYKWWFHVAPFTYVGNQEVVLDPQFLDGAVTMHDWTHFFIGDVIHSSPNPQPTREQSKCLDASLYEEYTSNDRSWYYCVLRKVPMYYFQPKDVDALDCQSGRRCSRVTVPTWRQNEISWAYGNTR